MSKRGGASDFNGFVSFGSDVTKTKRKGKEDGSFKQKNEESVPKRKPSSTANTTQASTRVNDQTFKETYSKTSDKPKQPVRGKIKNETNTPEQSGTKSRTSISKYTSIGTKQSKQKASSSEVSLKASTKSSTASPLLNANRTTNTTKQKVTKSGLEIIKQQASSILKNKPSNTSLSKNEIQPPISVKTSSKMMQAELGSLQHKMNSLKTKRAINKTKINPVADVKKNSNNLSYSPSLKSKSNSFKNQEQIMSNIVEPLDETEQLEIIHEVPHSMACAKEEAGMSMLPIQQLQKCEYIASHENDENEYNYEDDFEDYESDFEEYTRSDTSNIQSEVEEDCIESNSSIDDDNDDDTRDDYNAASSKTNFSEVDNSKTLQPYGSLSDNRVSTSSVSIDDEESRKVNHKPTSNIEEERKLDSGSYDLRSHSDTRRNKTIEDIKTAISYENANTIKQLQYQRFKYYTEDEGFVEVLSHDTCSNTHTALSSDIGLINFENLRKQQLKQTRKENNEKRGALLMNMIKLDIMTFYHLEIPAVPYDVYMKCYGRSNTLQIYTQTNDDCISEEMQTEDIQITSKWTQHPVKYSDHVSPEHMISAFSKERIGAGAEILYDDCENVVPRINTDSLRLHNFINKTGQIMLALLEDYEQTSHTKYKNKAAVQDFNFIEGCTSLNCDAIDFLKGRTISAVCFSESNSFSILSVHKPSTKPLTVKDESEGRCVVCIWDIREASHPQQMLVASNNITATCFHSNLVFSGLVDGVICLWDLNEQSSTHQQSSIINSSNLLWSPTYITADLEERKQHLTSVISIQILPENNPDGTVKNIAMQIPTQIISLDEDGLLVIWTIVKKKSSININAGLAPWGNVQLIQSSRLQMRAAFPKSIQSSVQCCCLAVDRLKPSNLYVGTNCGKVLHSLQTSTRANPQFYTASTERNTIITSMDFARCGHPLIMVGNSCGSIQIFRTMTEMPVLDIAATQGSPIKFLQWSPVQPGLFFVLDGNSRIHIWNLCVSDMSTQMTVSLPNQAFSCMRVSPHPCSGLLATGSESGSVNIYNLKPEFGGLSKEEDYEQNRIFNTYMTIL